MGTHKKEAATVQNATNQISNPSMQVVRGSLRGVLAVVMTGADRRYRNHARSNSMRRDSGQPVLANRQGQIVGDMVAAVCSKRDRSDAFRALELIDVLECRVARVDAIADCTVGRVFPTSSKSRFGVSLTGRACAQSLKEPSRKSFTSSG